MTALNWVEARRYAGLPPADNTLDETLHRAGEAVLAQAQPRGVWRVFPLTRSEEGLSIGGMELVSPTLSRHLEGCTQAALLAVTLGLDIDRLIQRTLLTDAGQAVLMQGCAAALLEGVCDAQEEEIAAAHPGQFLRPRFSPGYADLPLDCQGAILSRLEAPKRIGLTVTAAQMLLPTKSVTALVGLANHPGTCHIRGCATCGKLDCPFRKPDV